NMYQIKVINIPEFKWKEKGVKLDEIIKTIDLSETIIEAFSIEDFTAQKDMLFITDSGYIKKTTLDKFNTNYTKIMALKLKKGESLVKSDLVDRTREEKFFNIKTQKGLSFNIEEPSLEPVDRNIIGYKLFDILPNDSIKKVDFCDNYEYKSFYVNISKEGLITISDLKDNKSHISLFTDSSKTLVLFDDEGKAYYIPAFMLQSIKEEGINISAFTGDKISLLNAISTFRFEEDISIYFSSEKGLIKRTLLGELKIEGNSTQVYKFKHKDDKLVSILIKEHEEQKNILIITEKAMVIRFKSEAVNPMGKMASGVTGISLKDLDKVILALIIDENDTRKIKIKTKAKDKGTIEINKIKVQNRAGIGNSLMPLLLNDFVEVVEFKK
ncbi:DNA topoisomerase IV subunit A, partial [Clostridium botulinum CFSAN001627]